jgi:aquaglyceroporin related protein, other eukaryote
MGENQVGQLYRSPKTDFLMDRRSYIREPAAEFLGTMIMIIFGNGVDCQVVLSSKTAVVSSPKGVSRSDIWIPKVLSLTGHVYCRIICPLTLAGHVVCFVCLQFSGQGDHCVAGVAMGVWIAGGISGAHMNPA